MRFSVVVLICSALLACGKTGALYLPEEEPAASPSPAPAPQDEQAQESATEDSGKAN